MSTIIVGDIAAGQIWWGEVAFLKQQLKKQYQHTNPFMSTWKQLRADTKVVIRLISGEPHAIIYSGSGVFIIYPDLFSTFVADPSVHYTELSNIVGTDLKEKHPPAPPATPFYYGYGNSPLLPIRGFFYPNDTLNYAQHSGNWIASGNSFAIGWDETRVYIKGSRTNVLAITNLVGIRAASLAHGKLIVIADVGTVYTQNDLTAFIYSFSTVRPDITLTLETSFIIRHKNADGRAVVLGVDQGELLPIGGFMSDGVTLVTSHKWVQTPTILNNNVTDAFEVVEYLFNDTLTGITKYVIWDNMVGALGNYGFIEEAPLTAWPPANIGDIYPGDPVYNPYRAMLNAPGTIDFSTVPAPEWTSDGVPLSFVQMYVAHIIRDVVYLVGTGIIADDMVIPTNPGKHRQFLIKYKKKASYPYGYTGERTDLNTGRNLTYTDYALALFPYTITPTAYLFDTVGAFLYMDLEKDFVVVMRNIYNADHTVTASISVFRGEVEYPLADLAVTDTRTFPPAASSYFIVRYACANNVFIICFADYTVKLDIDRPEVSHYEKSNYRVDAYAEFSGASFPTLYKNPMSVTSL